jgi:hypothetical protein
MSDFPTDINPRTEIEQLIESHAQSPPSMADHPWAGINSSSHHYTAQSSLSRSAFKAGTSRIPAISTNFVSTSRPLECTVEGCPAIFNGEYRKGNLARHIRFKHVGGSKTYSCEGGCAKIFRRQDARLTHYRREHPHLATGPKKPRKV